MGRKRQSSIGGNCPFKLDYSSIVFWKADTDAETGESITHIVDGQQRIKALCSFVNNDFKLKTQFLLDKSAKEKYGNKYFKDLESEDKRIFGCIS